jgi:tRNA pseudouridine55 synthase
MLAVEGVLNIGKPAGITSHDVVDRVRRLAQIRRVGHAGTLDPLATGVLLVCLGRATRLAEYLVGRRKQYEATVRLGQATDTYDAAGRVVEERPIANVTLGTMTDALSQFRGAIQQQPPMYSAVKRSGQPLYKLARQGIQVERPSREVTVYSLEQIGWNPPDLCLRIVCSAGTYVRSLAHDLGEELGCGGHVSALERTAVGDFELGSAVSLAELNRDNLSTYTQSIDVAVAHLPRLNVTENGTKRLLQGQSIQHLPDHPRAPLVRAYDDGGRFIGVVARMEQLWQPRKMFYPLANDDLREESPAS